MASGDKVIGASDTLPTMKAAGYTGGLRVGKSTRVCAWRKVVTGQASAEIGEYCSRLFMIEGIVGPAEQANVRARRYGRRNIPYGGRHLSPPQARATNQQRSRRVGTR